MEQDISKLSSYKSGCEYFHTDLAISRYNFFSFLDLLDLVGDELLSEAFRIGKAAGARSMRYIEAICQRWHEAGITTVAEVKKEEAKRSANRRRSRTGVKYEYKEGDDFMSLLEGEG